MSVMRSVGQLSALVAVIAGLWGLSAPVAVAQVVLDPDAVLDLAEAPWRGRDEFSAALELALQGVDPERGIRGAVEPTDDPFLWSIRGYFGAPLPGTRRAGGVVLCARYGLQTRDRLLEGAVSDRATFALFASSLAAHDDGDVWPETAIARLSCMISWDDPRRVAIIGRDAAFAVLSDRFDAVSVQSRAADAPAYRLLGQDGRLDSLVWLESARIERGPSHQVIRFRSFLLSGGV